MNRLVAIHWNTVAPRPPEDAIDAGALLVESEPLIRHLSDAASGGNPLLILVNDSHRATPTRLVLNALTRLLPAMPRRPRLRVIVATGTHRFNDVERREFEAATLAGLGLPIERVDWHIATADDDLREIAGVRLHRAIAESAFLLPIGSLEPHYFAGVTGAHKTVTIGCMSQADIERNHAGALEPASDVLMLDGNPVHDGIARVIDGLKTAGKRILAINLISGDTQVVACSVGDPLATLHELVPVVSRTFVQPLSRPADLIHLRVARPLSRNFYQADKALKNNHLAVRDGGGMVLEADCPEGIGPDHFMGLLRRAPDYATARRIVADEGYRLGDHKAVKLRHLTDPAQRGVKVAIVSQNIAAADGATAGLRRFESISAALEWLAVAIDDPLAEGVVVEDAGNAVVRAKSA